MQHAADVQRADGGRCDAGEMMRYAQDQAIAQVISEERQQRRLADVRDRMRMALLTSFNHILEQHKDAENSRPAQLAGHILLNFWIGASAARAYAPLQALAL